MTIPLIKSNAKDLFFKAVLCYVAFDDLVGAKRAISTYNIEDPSFDGSREQKFLSAILQEIDGRNLQGYQSLIQEY